MTGPSPGPASAADGRAAPASDVRHPIVVGVAGGSGAGKSTVVREIVRRLAPREVTRIHHDAYYRDYGHLPPEERAAINFDHPDALETALLVAHLGELLDGRSVELPTYDFTSHTRTAETITARPTEVMIVDGILVLAHRELREMMDVKLYVDADADIRFIRRLDRDISERGRTVASVVSQYTRTVRPMHLEFVEPSKRYADIIIPEGGRNRVAIEMIAAKLAAVLDGAPLSGHPPDRR